MSLDLLQQPAEIESVRALKWSAPNAEHYRQTLLALADTVVIIDNSNEQVWSHLGSSWLHHSSERILA